jgi:hypothetical protein
MFLWNPASKSIYHARVQYRTADRMHSQVQRLAWTLRNDRSGFGNLIQGRPAAAERARPRHVHVRLREQVPGQANGGNGTGIRVAGDDGSEHAVQPPTPPPHLRPFAPVFQRLQHKSLDLLRLGSRSLCLSLSSGFDSFLEMQAGRLAFKAPPRRSNACRSDGSETLRSAFLFLFGSCLLTYETAEQLKDQDPFAIFLSSAALMLVRSRV